MIWKSVVGKLWITIILLVSVILSILTILLLQLFESYYVNQSETQLITLAKKVAKVMEENDDKAIALATTWEIVDANSTKIIVVPDKEKEWIAPNRNKKEEHVSIDEFKKDPDLQKVLTDREVIKKRATYASYKDDQEFRTQMLIVGVPVDFIEGKQGAVFVYQSLEVVDNTINHVKKIILLCAGIAIIMTTVFAFFLSSRVTAPLRKMKQTAQEMSEGTFEANIPIVTNDEIGELAVTFNRMSRQINTYVLALNQEKEQLASILRSMADGVITFSSVGNILITNPPALRFLKAWQFEVGENAPVIPERLKELFQTVVETEKEQTTEMEVQGHIYTIVMTPLIDQQRIRGAVAVLRDMTEERQLDKLRKDFIANVSHELRTPIAMLQGYSEAIVDDIAETEEDKKEMASIIHDESLRMGRLVNDLLDLAKVESGRIQLNQEQVSLPLFVERIIRKFLGVAKEQQIHLRLHTEIQEEDTMFDPDRIEQVLTNLIDNAIRHTPNDGTVTLSLIELDKKYEFQVKDTGVGIDKEDLPFVFERFYKADKARTRGRSGTGLGLAIAKNIIQAHDGMIEVNSKKNEGTTFTFTIPKQ